MSDPAPIVLRWLSTCHNAPVRAGGAPDFIADARIGTRYHVCTVCGEACSSYPTDSKGRRRS